MRHRCPGPAPGSRFIRPFAARQAPIRAIAVDLVAREFRRLALADHDHGPAHRIHLDRMRVSFVYRLQKQLHQHSIT